MELEVLGLPETLAQEETQTEQPVEEEEHNPILPEADELIFGSLAFLLVFVVLARYAFPRLNQGLKQREDKIRGDLEGAEEARKEAEASLQRYEQQLQEARAEAGRIIEEARQDADRLRADQQARLNEELAAARAQAQADIDAAKAQAMSELRGEVATIAIGAAESVVGANLDRDAQTRLIEDYINRVSTNGQG